MIFKKLFRKAKNRRGQFIFAGIGIFFLVFISIVILIPAAIEVTDMARDTEHLACSYTNLSTGQAGTCVVVDTALPIWVMVAGGAGLAYLGFRQLYA